MSLRAVHTDVQGSLLKGDSFVYAHLLKFERVIKTQSGWNRNFGVVRKIGQRNGTRPYDKTKETWKKT